MTRSKTCKSSTIRLPAALENLKLRLKKKRYIMAKVTGFLEFDRTENKSVNPKVRLKTSMNYTTHPGGSNNNHRGV